MIDWIDQLGHKYPFVLLAGMYIFNMATQSLPTPQDSSSVLYRWFFNFSHALAANWGLVGKVR